ncbi:hypothetical protein [Xanthomonas sp. XNM01]|uniref:hypothetical protein n=1 Tax=Xanthomonas sp. XNM01 TaxID=2769289 RepID=UPI00177F7A9C|nr:hypothetical protein [Xanthomonas sp. XNM01]MBD9370086.1 hypothetical protein [Xanthomonas sp. XNM01]
MQVNRKRFAVTTLTADSVMCDLPAIEIFEGDIGPIDLMIVSAGFEERVLALPRILATFDVATQMTTMVGRYRTNASDNDQRYAQLRPLLEKSSKDVREFDADDPPSVMAAIGDGVTSRASNGDALNVVFDISGASSTLIVSVMAGLIASSRKISLVIIYTAAQMYDQAPPAYGERFELEASREQGVGSVPLSAPFGGHHHDHLPAAVIALPSMYTSRLEACLTYLNVGPMTGSNQNLFWILPSTGVDEHRWRQERVKEVVDNLMLRFHGREGEVSSGAVIREDDMRSCDVLDSCNTARLLIEKIDDFSGNNISVVHMGSKMQAVGVALAAAAREEVAVLTVRPVSFNAATYSAGIGQTYRLDIGDLAVLVEKLSSIGSIRVESL